MSSEEDQKLLDKENDLNDRRLQINKDILQVKGLQFEESLRMNKLTLSGLTEEQALRSEFNRFLIGKDMGPAVEKAKELINYQYTKAEKLTTSISESISQGLTDAMLAAPGESDDAFRNMFKSIFTSLFKDEFNNQLKALLGKSGMISEGEIVADLIQEAMARGGIGAANAISMAIRGRPLDYTPDTGGISRRAPGEGLFGLSSNKVAIGSMFAMSAISSYSASQKKDIENAWAPVIGTVIGGIIGSIIPGGGTMAGMAVGGALGGLFVKSKKTEPPITVKDPAMEVLHRDLEYVNRNLVALRKPLELFALPASYYFSQKPASGVQVQGVVINIGSTDIGPDAITSAVANGVLSASKQLYQGV